MSNKVDETAADSKLQMNDEYLVRESDSDLRNSISSAAALMSSSSDVFNKRMAFMHN